MNYSEIRKYIKDTIIGKHEKGYQALENDEGNYLYDVSVENGQEVRNYKALIGTNFGISANTLQKHSRHPITANDMKNLSIDKAIDIYMKDYVEKAKITKLPPNLQKNVLDASINHGPSKAIIMLKDTIKAKASLKGLNIKEEEFPSTGKFDRQTESFLKLFPVTNNDYIESRKIEYDRVIENNPSQEEFRSNWMRRAESFRDAEQDEQPALQKFQKRDSNEKAMEEHTKQVKEEEKNTKEFLQPDVEEKSKRLQQMALSSLLKR